MGRGVEGSRDRKGEEEGGGREASLEHVERREKEGQLEQEGKRAQRVFCNFFKGRDYLTFFFNIVFFACTFACVP